MTVEVQRAVPAPPPAITKISVSSSAIGSHNFACVDAEAGGEGGAMLYEGRDGDIILSACALSAFDLIVFGRACVELGEQLT